jgi:hypothetical protein
LRDEVQELRDVKFEVEKWVNSRPSVPSRKEVFEKFPHAPQKIVKALLQSRKDREG